MKRLIAALVVVSACARPTAPTGLGAPESPGPTEPSAEEGLGLDESMTEEGMTDEALAYDAQFIDAMLAYAEYGKNLAEVGARRGQREEVKVDAENLRNEKVALINKLQNWRGHWYQGQRPVTKDLDQAAASLGLPAYEFGSAWQIQPSELNPNNPDAVKDMGRVTDVQNWNADQELAALRDLPDAAFDAVYTATLASNDIWGMQAAHASLEQLEHMELQTVAQEIVTDNLIHLNQVAQWRNEWFGAQMEGMEPAEPGTR